MANIKLHILDAPGSLKKLKSSLRSVFEESLASLPKDFIVNDVDIVVQDLPAWVIPELGIVGHTYSGHVVHIFIDSGHKIKHSDILKTIVHELHHAARWQSVGFGSTLGEVIVSEGLACLFEEEISGDIPIYANVKINEDTIARIKKEINIKKYDRGKWFFGSDKTVPRWFGYTYGYNLCKSYSALHNTTASLMVNTKLAKVLL